MWYWPRTYSERKGWLCSPTRRGAARAPPSAPTKRDSKAKPYSGSTDRSTSACRSSSRAPPPAAPMAWPAYIAEEFSAGRYAELAHAEIRKLCEAQEDLRRQAGKAKWLDLELTAELEASHGHAIWGRLAAWSRANAGSMPAPPPCRPGSFVARPITRASPTPSSWAAAWGGCPPAGRLKGDAG